jgi:hypothetical protein
LLWTGKLKSERKYRWNTGSNFPKCKGTDDYNCTLQVKIEVKVSLKKYGEVKVLLHSFLISTLDGCEWSVSPPRKEHPTHTEQDSCPSWELNHESSVAQPIA